jgi:hypothetical protein
MAKQTVREKAGDKVEEGLEQVKESKVAPR